MSTRNYVPSNRVSDELLNDLIDYLKERKSQEASDLLTELKSVRYKRLSSRELSSRVRRKMDEMDLTPLGELKRVVKNRRKKEDIKK